MSSATAVKVNTGTFAERVGTAIPRRASEVNTPARLRLVPSDQAMSMRTAYSIAAVVIGLGLVALLVLNVSLSSMTRDLSRESAELRLAKQNREQLQEQLLARQATQNLAKAAKKLGMVPAAGTAFVSVNSGEITGTVVTAKDPKAAKPKVAMPSSGNTADSTADAAKTD